MKKLFILTKCHNRRYLYYLLDNMNPVYVNSCMIQEIGLSCPFPCSSCVGCPFDPFVWQNGVNLVCKDYMDELTKRVFRVAHNLDR